VNWKLAEIKAMLSIFQEKNIQRLLECKKNRKNNIYKIVSDEMKSSQIRLPTDLQF